MERVEIFVFLLLWVGGCGWVVVVVVVAVCVDLIAAY